jgi:hypothetical protein
MSTKSLSTAGLTRSARRAEAQPIAPVAKAPALGANGRLEALTAADMPWLSKEGQAALADAPEVSGPSSYKKPPGWQ